MRTSAETAKKYYREKVLPRRVRDTVAEEEAYRHHDIRRTIYRRVLEDEEDRGELYPICSSGFQTFSNFGIGVGIYFMHLILLAGLFFICGLIMIVICYQFGKEQYGDPEETNGFIKITAACPPLINITATVGCDNNEPTCLIKYRPNCDVPSTAFTIDLMMSTLFAFALFASYYLEKHVIQKLDEAIQTAQDYSVVVLDPNDDAENPDEWYDYFSRFGEVKCISVIRNNEPILQLLLRLHSVDMKINHMKHQLIHINTNTSNVSLVKMAENHAQYTQKLDAYLQSKESIILQLQQAYVTPYPVVQVYATFEYEQNQKLCLESLEVPDIAAMYDIRDYAHTKYLFRQSNVLNVKEAPEPDNILWKNITIPNTIRSRRRWIANILTLGVLVASWYVIASWQGSSANSLAILIGMIDTMLPMLFEGIVNSFYPLQDSKKQATLQIRLFGARLLLSSFIPYWQVPWYQAVERSFIEQLISIQFTASFTSSMIALLDIKGHIDQYLLAPLFAETQEEYNAYWIGSSWSLAEKYTTLIKIICVTLFYSVLIPYSLFFGMLAFITVYCIDRYLLLRRWRKVPMLDNEIAVRLRQQGLFAICCHMYITYRFLYSWPMDETYMHTRVNENALSGGRLFTYHHGEWALSPTAIGHVFFEKVNKFPGYNIYSLPIHARWHNENQLYYLPYYLILFTIVLIITTMIWVIIPCYHWTQKVFFKQFRITGEAQSMPFSHLHNLTVYDPLVYDTKTNRSYQCAYGPTIPSRLRKRFVRTEKHPNQMRYSLGDAELGDIQQEVVLEQVEDGDENDNEIDDLSVYVPELHQPYVLSVMKYYPSETEKLHTRFRETVKQVSQGKEQRVGTGGEEASIKHKKKQKKSWEEDDEEEEEGESEDSEQKASEQGRKSGRKSIHAAENSSAEEGEEKRMKTDEEAQELDEEDVKIIRRTKSVRFQRDSSITSSHGSVAEAISSSSLPIPFIRASSRESNKYIYQPVTTSVVTTAQLIQLGLHEEGEHDDQQRTTPLPSSLLAKITPREVELTVVSSSSNTVQEGNNRAFSKPRRYFAPESNTSYVDIDGNKKFMVTSLDL